MPYKNKDDQRKHNANYHSHYDKKPEVKEKRKLLRQQRCKRNKDYILSIITPCISCGESDPVVIDFHHLNENKKEHGISKLVQSSGSISKIKSEIDKCVCLCSNCHRKVHAGTLTLLESNQRPLV